MEGVFNSRPLTYLCEDEGEPLTPSQLVIGRRLMSNPREALTEVLENTAAILLENLVARLTNAIT